METMRQKVEDAASSARESVREWRDSAQDVAKRGTRYLQDRFEEADEAVAEVTGRPLGSWTADAQQYIRQHPLRSAAITLGIGFFLGQMLSRR